MFQRSNARLNGATLYFIWVTALWNVMRIYIIIHAHFGGGLQILLKLATS